MQYLKAEKHFYAPKFKTLREMIYRTVRRYPKDAFYLYKRSPKAAAEAVPYHRLAGHLEALGTALMRRGFGGARVALIGQNSYAWSLVHLCNLCGLGLSVPLDRLLPAGELEETLRRARPRIIFYDPSFAEVMADFRERLDFIECFVEMDEAAGIEAPVPAGEGLERKARRLHKLNQAELRNLRRKARRSVEQGAQSEQPNSPEPRRNMRLSELLLEGLQWRLLGLRDYLDLSPQPEDAASLLFTSGTTSFSKAVLLSQRNLTAEIRGLAQVVRYRPSLRSLSLLPLHHTFENSCGLLTVIYFGGTVCANDGLRYIQQNMCEYRINLIIGVPLIFESFYRRVKQQLAKEGKEQTLQKAIRISEWFRGFGIDLRGLLFRKIKKAFGGSFSSGICGAAPADPEMLRFFDQVGIRILQGYGLTETSPVAAGCNSRLFVPGSVGRPIGGVELAVDCAQDGEEGEILIRGDIVMEGYMQEDGSLDRSSIDAEGWFHTGDMGRIENKVLYITGRVKSMIVLPNGKKVFPEEIEYLLNRSPLIKSSMVWGEDLGNDVFVSAKLVLQAPPRDKEGQATSEEGLREMLDQLIYEVNQHMPSFKSIKYYVYSFQDMVSTTTMKIKRNVEQAQIKEQFRRSQTSIKEQNRHNIDLLGPAAAELKEGKGPDAGSGED